MFEQSSYEIHFSFKIYVLKFIQRSADNYKRIHYLYVYGSTIFHQHQIKILNIFLDFTRTDI